MNNYGAEEFSDDECYLYDAGFVLKDRAFVHALGFIKAVEQISKKDGRE